jgi:hypothetical protein
MDTEHMVNETTPEVTQEQENQSPDIVDQPREKRTSPDESFRALREKAEKAERERDAYQRTLQEIEMRAALYQQQAQQQQKPVEPEIDPNDEDLLEGKHYKKLVNKYKALEEKLEHATRKSYETVIESRIRSKYDDFDTVVNADSIKALRESEPELAASLHANPDIESKAIATYKAIKRLGLQPSTEYNADKEQAQKNASKPKSLSSISPQQGESPLSRANAFANGLTEDLRKQLLKEMEQARKSY